MNEYKLRRALLTAFGGTGSVTNERNFEKNLIDAVESSIPASKPEVVALVALTDNSGGTPGNTIADVPGTYTEATLANQIASLTAKVNAIIAALKA